MSSNTSGGPGGRQRVLFWVALASALAGSALVAVFLVSQDSPPTVDSSAATARETSGPPTGAAARTGDSGQPTHNRGAGRHARDPLAASRPTRIEIPAIDVAADVIGIGMAANGELNAPSGEHIDDAAWFENSPTPGQTGPSVIEGHIDTDSGPSVFYRLAALRPGDQIEIARADGSTVTFTVTRLRDYPSKDAFPTQLVYGGNVDEPSLRLITCSNFDHSVGHYAGNTVVYATLSHARR